MADILNLVGRSGGQHFRQTDKNACLELSAEIIIFPGVRYEHSEKIPQSSANSSGRNSLKTPAE